MKGLKKGERSSSAFVRYQFMVSKGVMAWG